MMKNSNLINKPPELKLGYDRQWHICAECGDVWYYDVSKRKPSPVNTQCCNGRKMNISGSQAFDCMAQSGAMT